MLQDRLGANKAAAFDLRSGCTGFIYGLSVASQFISSGMYQRVLVVGAEVITPFVDWNDRRTCVLFGDGAGCAVLEARDEPGGIGLIRLGSKGSNWDSLYVVGAGSAYPLCPATWTERRHCLQMDGQTLGRFAVRTMLRRTRETIRASGLSWSDVDLLIPHQANLRLIEFAVKKLRFPMDKVFVNVDRYANMSTASIPVALCEAAEQGRLKDGDRVMLVGFGSGLTWATALIQWGAPERPRRRLVWWRFVPMRRETLNTVRDRVRSVAQTVSSAAGTLLMPFLSSFRRKK
jgi:3-oxoacyl-[acyl-carrier-protein] synthase-3